MLSNSVLRLRNEYEAMHQVAHSTTIPIPRVLAFSDDAFNPYIVLEYVDSRPMSKLTDPREVELCIEQLKRYLRQLSFEITRPLVPPSRLAISQSEFSKLVAWDQVRPKRGPPLCHGDLSRHNVLIHPTQPQVVSVIDWEYAGYYPRQFDPLYAADACGHVRVGATVLSPRDYGDMCVKLTAMHSSGATLGQTIQAQARRNKNAEHIP